MAEDVITEVRQDVPVPLASADIAEIRDLQLDSQEPDENAAPVQDEKAPAATEAPKPKKLSFIKRIERKVMGAIEHVDNELNKPHWREAWNDAKQAPVYVEKDLMKGLNWVGNGMSKVYERITKKKSQPQEAKQEAENVPPEVVEDPSNAPTENQAGEQIVEPPLQIETVDENPDITPVEQTPESETAPFEVVQAAEEVVPVNDLPESDDTPADATSEEEQDNPNTDQLEEGQPEEDN